MIDEQTGARQLIWSELDVNAGSAAATNLMIHPGKNFTEGHTYIVALRDLRNAAGRPDRRAGGGLRNCATASRCRAAERSQQARYARIFTALKRAGIARSSLVRGVGLHDRLSARA